MKEGYKMTKLGEIPVDWEVVKLIDISLDGINNGVFNDPKKVGKGYRLINVKNMFSAYKIERDTLTLLDLDKNTFTKNKVEYGDIFFTRSSLVKEGIAYSNVNLDFHDDLTYDGHLMKIRPNQEEWSSIFLSYYFRSHIARKFFIQKGKTATMTTISQSDIAGVPVPLPPLPEQKKIAQILSSTDEKIALIQEQIHETQALKKGLMQRLLTRGIGHTEFKASPLGEVPVCWEVVKLKKVSDFSNGKGHEQYIDEKGAYIVVNSKFISTNSKVKKYSNKNLCPLIENDITIVMSDVPNGKAIGKCFLIDKNNTYTLNQRIGSIKAHSNLDTKFLFYVLNRNRYYLFFDNGVSQTNLRKDEVISCPIPLPPLPEQKKIAQILSTTDDKLQVLRDKQAYYEQLKKGLMQQLLTGKVRVAVD